LHNKKLCARVHAARDSFSASRSASTYLGPETWIDHACERFPLDGHPTRVPGDGGYEAIFSAKGDKIFYRLGDRIVEVAFTVTRDRVSFSTPKTYVKFGFADFLGRGYKVGNDDRMLVKLLPSTTPQSEIRVMTGTR
jgi:hypothetical protein